MRVPWPPSLRLQDPFHRLAFSTWGQAAWEYQALKGGTWVGRMGAREVGHPVRGHGLPSRRKSARQEVGRDFLGSLGATSTEGCA